MFARIFLVAALPLTLASAAQETPTQLKTEKAWSAALLSGVTGAQCRKAIGIELAQSLVRYCRYVSTATHPPCNSQNSCELIAEHISYMAHGTNPPNPWLLPGGAAMHREEWHRVGMLTAD